MCVDLCNVKMQKHLYYMCLIIKVDILIFFVYILRESFFRLFYNDTRKEMRKMKKIASIILSLCLLLSVFMPLTAIVTSAAATDNTVSPNLVAYYDFEDSANLGKDVSGNGNNLTAVGGTVSSTTGKSDDTHAALFDGASVLAATEVDGLDFSDSFNSFTFSCYVKFGDVTSTARIINTGYNGNQAGATIIANRWSDNIYFKGIVGDSEDGTNATNKKDHYSDGSVTLSSCGSYDWHHYVMAYDSTTKTVKMFFDGEQVHTYTLTYGEHMSTSLTFALGGSYSAYNSSMSGLLSGSLDEVKIFDSCVTDIDAIETAKMNSNVIWYDKRPVTDYEYSFAFIGDTQKINLNRPEKYYNLYDWVIENKENKKIEYVLELGDITDEDTDPEWNRAVMVHDKLEDNNIPYTVIRGNHDSKNMFVENFSMEKYGHLVDGSGDGTMLNTYRTFRAGNIDYLVMGLDYGPTEEVLEWACGVAEEHPNHNIIILTHSFLENDGTVKGEDGAVTPIYNGGSTTGLDIWNNFAKKYSNISMIISGHNSYDTVMRTTAVGDNGNTVQQFLIDPQRMDDDFGGVGMVAMFYFSENGSKVDVEWYSTDKKLYYKPESQYSFDLTPVAPTDSVEVTVNASTGGTVNDESGCYSNGTTLRLSATPQEGYKFVRWESNAGGTFSNTESAKTNYTVNGVATVTAIFEETDEPLPKDDYMPNLLAYYDFENSERIGEDKSGKHNHLSQFGSGTVTQTQGVDGMAASFDGATALVTSALSGKEFSDTLDSFTISFYSKVDGNTTNNMRVISSGYNGNQSGIALMTDKTQGYIRFRPILGDSDDGTSSTENKKDHYGSLVKLESDVNNWHNYVITYDRSTKLVKTYVDGVKLLEYTLTYGAHMNSSAFKFALGGSVSTSSTNPSSAFIGCIDELKVFDGAVNDLSVIESYGSVVPEHNAENSHLVAYYNFDNANDFGWDASGQGNHLTQVGTTLSAVEGTSGTAANFDGRSALGAFVNDFTDNLTSFTISFDAQVGYNAESTNMRAFSSGYYGTREGMAICFTRSSNTTNKITYRGIVADSITGDNSVPYFDHWQHLYSFNTPQTAWHHYVMTYDAETGTIKSFVDGQLVKRYFMGFKEHMDDSQPFAIGGVSYNVNHLVNAFVGAIDEVKIFDTCLSDPVVAEKTDYYVTEEAFGIVGDANGDKSFDARDLVRLKKYCAYVEVDITSNADMDKDAHIAAKDLSEMRKQLIESDYIPNEKDTAPVFIAPQIPESVENASDCFDVTVNDSNIGIYSDENYSGGNVDYGYWNIEDGFTSKVVVRTGFDFESVKVYPENLAIEPTVNGNTISFEITENEQQLSLVFDDDYKGNALHLFVNDIDKAPADSEKENVIYFGKGYHDLTQTYENGVMELTDNQIVYIDAGAVVRGGFSIREASHVTIKGSGVILSNLAENSPKCIDTYLSEHILVDGVIANLAVAKQWTTHFCFSNDITVNNYKVISPHYASTDAIDISNSQNVTINNCFLRASDDCVSIKGLGDETSAPSDNPAVENITVQNTVMWNDCNSTMCIGAETRAASFNNITFKNIDVIYSYDDPKLHGQLNDRSVMNIVALWGTDISNVTWEDIRVNECEALIQCSYAENFHNGVLTGNLADYTGTIDGITFKNITADSTSDSALAGSIAFAGYSADHGISNVTLENVIVNDNAITSDDIIIRDDYVMNVNIAE